MEKENYDFLVIGSGVAGLYFALEAAEYGKVLVITKDEIAASNTLYAQGGIATVAKIEDSFEKHIEDTLVAGVELCNKDIVTMIIREGPAVIDKLIEYGVNFTKEEDEKGYSLHKEGGHSEHRIYHFDDITGQEVVRGLVKKVLENNNITVRSQMAAIDLLTEHQKGTEHETQGEISCYGAYVLNIKSNEIEKITARTTILATGGSGQVYLHTTNPEVATGDGVAMAYRAKATISNLEFFQFHPTTLYDEKSEGRSFLITEAVRGFGGVLKTKNGKEFMQNYHPLKSLAPRDVVARAIDNEMKKSGVNCVYLDVHKFPSSQIIKSFPNIYKKCLEKGIDITKEMIPVVPAAHYQCGGILTDRYGRTDIHGLFAVGEVACTGLHGANRLASNSLLEALVLATKAAEAANEYLKNEEIDLTGIRDWDHGNSTRPQEKIVIKYLKQAINNLMSDFVGIVRSNQRLDFAMETIDVLLRQVRNYYFKTRISRELIELRNLADVASLIIRFSIYRKESRGLHYTIDYPEKDNQNWRKNTRIKSGGKTSKESID